MERDAADVLIKSIKLSPDKSALIVENELGDSFTVNLADRSVNPPDALVARKLGQLSQTPPRRLKTPSDLPEPPEIDQDLLQQILDEERRERDGHDRGGGKGRHLVSVASDGYVELLNSSNLAINIPEGVPFPDLPNTSR